MYLYRNKVHWFAVQLIPACVDSQNLDHSKSTKKHASHLPAFVLEKSEEIVKSHSSESEALHGKIRINPSKKATIKAFRTKLVQKTAVKIPYPNP